MMIIIINCEFLNKNQRVDDRKTRCLRTKEVRKKNNNQFLKLIVCCCLFFFLLSFSLCVCVYGYLCVSRPLEYIFGYDSVLDIYYPTFEYLVYICGTQKLTHWLLLLTICGSKFFFGGTHRHTDTHMGLHINKFSNVV